MPALRKYGGQHGLHETKENADGGTDEPVGPGQVGDAGQRAADGQFGCHPQSDLLHHRDGGMK